jgi:hypothetical protein
MLAVSVPLLQRSAKERGLFQHAGAFSEHMQKAECERMGKYAHFTSYIRTSVHF